METETIKGICEHCGFPYQGDIIMQQGSFPAIKCPQCGEQTDNFDEAGTVDELNKREHNLLTYTKVAKFEIA